MSSRLASAEKPTTAASVWSAPTILLLISTLAFATFGAFVTSLPTMLASAVLGACLLPRNALPALALWLLVLIPLGVMDIPTVLGRYFTPAVLVIALWMFRVAFAQRMTQLLRVPIRGWLIIVPFFVLLFASAFVSERIDLTLAWL